MIPPSKPGLPEVLVKTLDRAVERGILSVDQRDAVLALEAGGSARLADRPITSDAAHHSIDEPMRLVSGGNDLFVTVGIALLFAGGLFALSALAPEAPILRTVILAAGLLILAEIVTRQKRMRLASTVLALGFTAMVTNGLVIWVVRRFDLGALDSLVEILALRSQATTIGLVIGGGGFLVATLYFLRYRVPVLAAVAALTATGLAFLFALLFYYDGITGGAIAAPSPETVPDVLERALLVPLVCGGLIFALAVMLDLHDRDRETIWSDCAFWLHVVSAPLLVHPLFILATGQDVMLGRIEPEASASLMLGLLIGGFVLVALAIDRRSLLAPTLAYFGSIGIYYLVNTAANTTGIPPFALILIAIGALVILFGAGWQRIRRLIVGNLFPTSVLNALPPIKA